jgi:hypothetical protein
LCEIYWFLQPELQYFWVLETWIKSRLTLAYILYVHVLDFCSAPGVQACSLSES